MDRVLCHKGILPSCLHIRYHPPVFLSRRKVNNWFRDQEQRNCRQNPGQIRLFHKDTKVNQFIQKSRGRSHL
eukprot:scaffold572723_cov173-Attheya_sp.AAC.1